MNRCVSRRAGVTVLVVAAWLAPAAARQDQTRPAAPIASSCPVAAALDASFADASTDFDAGRAPHGLATLQAILTRAQTEHCQRYEAEALRRLAVGDRFVRAFPAALTKLDRALTLFRGAGDRAGEARTLAEMGFTLVGLDRRKDAADVLLQAHAVSTETHDIPTLVGVDDHLMYLLGPGQQKDVLRAEALALTAADPTFKSVGCNVLHEWGDDLFNADNYAAAYGKLTEAIACFEAVDDPGRLGRALVSLGRVYRAHGRLDLALAQYRRALALQQQAHDTMGAIQSMNAIGVTLGFMGRSAASVEMVQQALAAAAGSPRTAAFLRANLAGAYLDLRRFREAAQMLEARVDNEDPGFASVRRLQLARAYQGLGWLSRALDQVNQSVAAAINPDQKIEALSARADVLIQLRRFDAASDDLRQATEAVEALRLNTVADDFLKRGFGDWHQRLYATRISLLLAQHKPREALAAAESARARAFLDLLSARSAAQTAQAQPGLPTPVQLTAGEQATALPATAADIVATAGRLHSTILSYWVDAAATWVWVIRPDGRITATRLDVTANRLTSLVSDATGVFADRAQPSGVLDGRAAARPWRELYTLLVQPIRASLPSRAGARLTIVPHGPLFGLPFAALLDSTDHYLIEQYEIHYAAAAGVLDYTSRPRPPRERSSLLVGDPAAATAGDALNVLPAMPWARREVAAIASIVPGNKTVLVGDEASEANVRSQLAGRTLLHFATHGIVRNSESLASYLALHPTGSEADQDGRLTADETYTLNLDADLIVLSGCRTALGPVLGDGVIGFTRAFLAAGASTVIATMWDVPDQTSFEVMRAFYRTWTAGHGPAWSLRAAQIEVIRSLRAGRIRTAGAALPEIPLLWAGFAVIGEP